MLTVIFILFVESAFSNSVLEMIHGKTVYNKMFFSKKKKWYFSQFFLFFFFLWIIFCWNQLSSKKYTVEK